MSRRIVLVAAAFIAAACTSAGSASDIEGIWAAKSFRLNGATQVVTPGVNVVHTQWVSIEGETVQGEAGCNGFGGSYSVTDDGATLSMEDVFMESGFCLPDG